MRTVLVTGVTGKSGQYFMKKILQEVNRAKNYRFILLCRKQNIESVNTEGYALVKQLVENVELHVDAVEASLTDENAVKKVLLENKVDMVLHIASVKLSLNIVPIAMACGVNDFVLVHTTGIYSKYKAAGEEYRVIETKLNKLADEYRANNRPIAITILRPTMIYGDLNDKNVIVFIKMVDKLRIFPTVNGAKYDLQPVWCKDLGDAYFEVVDRWNITKNKEYILSGGAPIQLIDMFKVMAKQLGVTNTFISVPFCMAYSGAWIIYCMTFGKIDLREKVQRLVEPRAFEHKEATEDFGYSPACFEEGLKEELEMYKKSK